jgi:hypothetical protein
VRLANLRHLVATGRHLRICRTPDFRPKSQVKESVGICSFQPLFRAELSKHPDCPERSQRMKGLLLTGRTRNGVLSDISPRQRHRARPMGTYRDDRSSRLKVPGFWSGRRPGQLLLKQDTRAVLAETGHAASGATVSFTYRHVVAVPTPFVASDSVRAASPACRFHRGGRHWRLPYQGLPWPQRQHATRSPET